MTSKDIFNTFYAIPFDGENGEEMADDQNRKELKKDEERNEVYDSGLEETREHFLFFCDLLFLSVHLFFLCLTYSIY